MEGFIRLNLTSIHPVCFLPQRRPTVEPRLKAMFTPEILEEAKRRYAIAELTALDGFENFIYEYASPEGDRILRISHEFRRPLGMVRAETEFIDHLHRNGVNACAPCRSIRGNLVEAIPATDGHFLAVSFHKAPGGFVPFSDRTPDLLRELGATMGRIHRLTRDHPIPPIGRRRPSWFEEVDGMAEKYLGPGEEKVIVRFNENIREIRSLPASPETYGLVHMDMHGGNFFVHEGKIWLFDFDDCQYHFFAADIAMPLFYAIPLGDRNNESEQSLQRFFRCFIEGYHSENTLPDGWLERIPLFFKQREIDLYIAIRRSFTPDQYDEWVTNYMTDRKEKIEAGAPFWPPFEKLCL
jgi:amicoumacin kinase